MCDVLVAMPDSTKNGRVVFGKNSDRPAGECQVLYRSPGGHRERGSVIKCSYVVVPDAGHVFSTLGCRPYWCRGYETGMNEAGVAGGNTAIFTRSLWDSGNRKVPGLTGMELLRLGLERGDSAEKVADVIIELLETYGQWGSAVQGKTHEQGSYENAFLLADGKEAWVLETTGRRWVAERITKSIRSISNEPTIRDQWIKGSDDIREFAQEKGWWKQDEKRFDFALACNDHEHYSRQVSHIRLMRSSELLSRHRGAMDARIMMKILRDHYEDTFLQGPQFHPFLPDFHTLCMHESPAGFTWGNTATSMVVEIDPEDRTPPPCWICYLPPCAGIYMAYDLFVPLPDIVTNAGSAGLITRPAPDTPTDGYSGSSLWWRLNRIVEEVMKDPVRRQIELRALFDPIEKRNLERIEKLPEAPVETRQREFSKIVQEEIADVMAVLDLIEKQWNIHTVSMKKGEEKKQ